jgi:F-type H+-transporting ATPase subunit gamma
MLSALVRNHIFASVFRASAEAMVTENAARLALMQQAEQSVGERLAAVRRQLASARQDEITHELMDIVIGHLGEAADNRRPAARNRHTNPSP